LETRDKFGQKKDKSSLLTSKLSIDQILISSLED